MMFIGYYNYTVLLTYAGAMASILGIYFAVSGNSFWAVICLQFAGLSDMFDGKIAATMDRNEKEKLFGIQIDSLCDLVSFGVLPTVIGWSLGLRGVIFFLSALFFIMNAVIRLSYFNVDETLRQRVETGRRKFYCGCPVTASALLFPLIYGLSNLLGGATPVIYQIALFVLGALFVLKFYIPKPAKAGLFLFLGLGLVTAVLVFTVGL
ncbi:MAG TPA: CDP-alcohol phosphatidyltransferase family protein [Oscillospiraceae bacterium]|nr:CDP-alcohol phosphatidyltransferase family protein [Oscillospiraceae bacterium]HRW56325.1 CDP-alcohol phosphatidyltransferase family protein [Oscillospiraceae bacterium]